MSIKNFVCPDGGIISTDKCLEPGGCRMGDRCATRPYLMMARSERPQKFRCIRNHEIQLPATNKNFEQYCRVCLKEPANVDKIINANMYYVPSTTQLIAGTMDAFLRLTTDIDIAPDSRAFMITGTKGHAALESFNDEQSFLEEKFLDEDVTGIADLLTQEDGLTILSDYKVSGSFKVAKALGFETYDEPTGVFYKSGSRKGQERTRKCVRRNPKAIDRFEWELQLNKYRMNFEKQGFEVDKMKIQCVVRDGNTHIARSRGIFRNVYYFDVNRLDDKFVVDYFENKRQRLLKALRQGYWNEVCNNKENWDGLKCALYCDGANSCSLGKYLKREKTKESVDMPIQGLSEARRLPRMGKIRLGVMMTKKVEGKPDVQYPKEVKHFILDPAVANEAEKKRLVEIFEQKYGKEPTSIDIMFPVADIEQMFPQYYKSYGKSTMLNCKGDGVNAETNNEEYAKRLKVIGEGEFGKRVECKGKECPYFQEKKCAAVATLSVLLPELPGSGVWQVTTGSMNSILNLNSCFDYIRALTGRYHMIPLKLERREQEIPHEGKKTKHYVLHINLEMSLNELQKRALIDPVKSAMLLPPIEDEKKDLIYEKNETINPEEYKEQNGNGQAWDADLNPDGSRKDGQPVEQPAEEQEKLTNKPSDALTCTNCDKVISEKVKNYSKEKFGKPLCYDCQKTAK